MSDPMSTNARRILVPVLAAALLACEAQPPPSEASGSSASGAAKEAPSDPSPAATDPTGSKSATQSFTPACQPQAETCNGKDDDCDGAIAEFAAGCSFCPRTIGYWKTHPDLWPVSTISVGAGSYTVDLAITQILEKASSSDATRMLAAQLVGAKLNVLMAAVGGDAIASTIAAADAFLMDHPLGSDPQGADRDDALGLKDKLDAFNNSGEKGCTCAPKCDGKECGPDGCGSYCGVCGSGAECSEGQCQCIPSLEVCDGIDNDCDGQKDEDLGTLSCGIGACKVTVTACLDGEIQLCVPGQPSPETCNGLDDNCDFVVDAIACDDGSACTIDDLCLAGVCDGSPVDCADSNPCTDDACDPATGCSCDANAAPCDDWNDCTTTDLCVDKVCVGFAELTCDDANACTSDECVPGGGCKHSPLSQVPCSDGSPCTGLDWCQAGACQAGGPVSCNDDNPCTKDGCDAAFGCVHTPDTDLEQVFVSCGVGACKVTVAACLGGVPQSCTPGAPSAEACNGLDDDCDFVVDAIPCDDDDACTIDDLCLAGACGSSVVDCNDGNPCTDDLCDSVTGCYCTDNTKPCDDGDACTVTDICSDKGCVGSGAPSCDDGNPCTADGCASDAGCTHTPQAGPCTDGDACTTADACVGGACQSGAPLSCDDGNPCTTDGCSPAAGCAHGAVADGTSCDDGNACSGTCPGQSPGTLHRYAVTTAWTDPAVGWAGSGHSIVVGGLIDGVNGVVLTAQPDLVFDVLDDGSAHMHGTAVVTAGGPLGEAWSVDIWWSLRGVGPAGQGSGGPKLELIAGVQTPALTNTWSYYDMWPGGAFLTKVGSPKDIAWLTQVPAGSVYPYQVGVGANGKNLHFGASGWIGYTRYTAAGATWSGKGDINVDTTELPLCVPGDTCHAGMCGNPAETCSQ